MPRTPVPWQSQHNTSPESQIIVPKRYRDMFPSEPLLRNAHQGRPSAAALMTLNYFRIAPAEMPVETYAEHHVLMNLNETPQRVLNWRDGIEFDYQFKKDDVVLTPAGIKSGWRWFDEAHTIVATLDPEQVKWFAETELSMILSQQQLADNQLRSDPEICAAARMILDAMGSSDKASAIMFESLARVFLVKLLQTYGDTEPEIKALSSKFTADHYRAVLNYIESNLSEPILLEDLAAQTAMSTSHFSRVFRQTIGSSPGQYVINYRAEQAAKMLGDPTLPISEVAIRCGFSDQPHLTRVFKKSFGITPRSYRARNAS
ncbi:MAG: AraC family transcriptional regulator [Pseudomonadota bacterium]